MAKKSSIEREKRLEETVRKYAERRKKLLRDIKKAESTYVNENNATHESDVQFAATTQISKLYRKFNRIPRDASPSRRRNRCWVTGRSRGFYRDFGLSRHVIRELGNEGLLPGLQRASW